VYGPKTVEAYSTMGCTSDKYAPDFISLEHLYKFLLGKFSILVALADNYIVNVLGKVKDIFVVNITPR